MKNTRRRFIGQIAAVTGASVIAANAPLAGSVDPRKLPNVTITNPYTMLSGSTAFLNGRELKGVVTVSEREGWIDAYDRGEYAMSAAIIRHYGDALMWFGVVEGETQDQLREWAREWEAQRGNV